MTVNDTPNPTSQDGASEPTTNTEPKFTQADLDRLAAKVRHEVTAKFGDYETIKTKASKLDELEQASKSELERERDARTAAETRAAERERVANQRLIRAAVIGAATRAGAVDAETVAALLPADAITIDDNGEVHGVADAVIALLEAKPFLVASKTPPAPAGGQATNPPANRTAGSITDISGMTPSEISKALAEGRLDGLL